MRSKLVFVALLGMLVSAAVHAADYEIEKTITFSSFDPEIGLSYDPEPTTGASAIQDLVNSGDLDELGLDAAARGLSLFSDFASPANEQTLRQAVDLYISNYQEWMDFELDVAKVRFHFGIARKVQVESSVNQYWLRIEMGIVDENGDGRWGQLVYQAMGLRSFVPDIAQLVRQRAQPSSLTDTLANAIYLALHNPASGIARALDAPSAQRQLASLLSTGMNFFVATASGSLDRQEEVRRQAVKSCIDVGFLLGESKRHTYTTGRGRQQVRFAFVCAIHR